MPSGKLEKVEEDPDYIPESSSSEDEFDKTKFENLLSKK